jgi:glycine/D-amino acid oxidase-like deaminating enzyme
MNLKSGLPYSLIKYGLLSDYPKLSKNMRADVVIVGGGIAGAIMGWHLAEQNIDALLIDGRTIGLGSTCASSSLLLYEIDTPLYKLQDMQGTKVANLVYRLSQESVSDLTKLASKIKFDGIEVKESIYYAAKLNHIDALKKEYAARKNAGIEVQYVGGNSARKETGLNIPAAIISSLAAQTDAYAFTHAIHAASIKKGLAIFDRTKAEKINHHKSGITIETNQGYVIKAKKVVYATGYETAAFIKKPIVKLRSTYATISESYGQEQKFWKNERLVWNTADPYLYMRTTPDKRILVGGRDENFYDPAKRNKLIVPKSKQLAKDFHGILPEMQFVPEFSWTGTFGDTHDGLPYIGQYPGMPGAYFALGFGGNGITFSILAAKIISGLILGKKQKNVSLFSFER